MPSLFQIGKSVIPIFIEMEQAGIPALRSRFQTLHTELNRELTTIRNDIIHTYNDGKPFNPKSGPQVGALLERLNLADDIPTTRTTGQISTKKDHIEHLGASVLVIARIFDYRHAQHALDSFVTKPLSLSPPEGSEDLLYGDQYYIHGRINPYRTHSRRISMRDPKESLNPHERYVNLITIPKRTELGRRIRHCYSFHDESPLTLGFWDLSQIEMRCMAHLSADTFMCQLFHEGRDIHSETAAKVFGINIDDVHPMDHRQPAKATGFGILYGISGRGLSIQLRSDGCEGWTEDRCDELLNEWFKVYPGVRSFQKRTANIAARQGYVQTPITGMYRYLPGIYSPNPGVRNEAARQAVSHLVQGMAQDMLQNSMVHLRPLILNLQRDAKLPITFRLQVHDELILSFPPSLWDTLNPLMIDALTNHCGVKLRVPVEADGEMRKAWGKV